MKFQITMNDELLHRVNAYSACFGISRSSAISVLCSSALSASAQFVSYEKKNKTLNIKKKGYFYG